MAVDRTWVGTTTDWNTAANWNPAAIPLDTDRVHFTGASNVSVAGITPGAAGDALGEINVHEDYTGVIGTSGSKLILTSITTVRFNGRGSKLFLDAGITDLILSPQLGVTDFGEFDGTIAAVQVVSCSGSMAITGGAAVTAIDMHDSPHCVLTVNAGVTALTTIRQSSGRIINNSAVNPGAGIILVAGTALYEQLLGEVDTVLVMGPTARYLDKSSGGGDLIVAMPGGIFDGRQNANAPTVTFTDALSYPGGQIRLNNALKSYVITNGIQDQGGQYAYERGQAVS